MTRAIAAELQNSKQSKSEKLFCHMYLRNTTPTPTPSIYLTISAAGMKLALGQSITEYSDATR
jgi:hypothetical protein